MSRGAEVNLSKLTRREFADRMDSGTLGACIVPVGATEQHGDHLVFGHDWRSVLHVAEETARRLSPRVLVAPAVMAGVSEHHMKHRGTLTLRPSTFLALLDDVVGSVVRAGFARVLVLNGHGGNVKPCEGAWEQLLRVWQVNLQFISYWDVLDERDARELLRGGHRLPDDLPGHAGEFEAAIALAAFPEGVRRDFLAGAALRADAERGRELLGRVTERLAVFVEAMLNGERIAPIPPFYE